MYGQGRPRKDRTGISRVIAHRDDHVPTQTEHFLGPLRPRLLDGNSMSAENAEGVGIDLLGGFGAGARHLHPLASPGPEERLGDLAPRGIGGAEDQDAKWKPHLSYDNGFGPRRTTPKPMPLRLRKVGHRRERIERRSRHYEDVELDQLTLLPKPELYPSPISTVGPQKEERYRAARPGWIHPEDAERPISGPRRTLGWRLVGVLPILATSIAGCGEEAGLSVGEVSFARSDLLGLSEEQTDLLAAISTVGLAAAGGEAARVGAPVIEAARARFLVDRLRQETALEAFGVTEEALEARYQERPELELSVRHLVILSERWRSETERSEALARAEAALSRARAGEPFPDLAGEVSEEPGAAERGGLLQPGREGTWVDEFWQAALGLEVGEISEVVETEYGFHVLHLDAREPVPFDEARSRVVEEVATELDTPEAWRGRIQALTGEEGNAEEDGVRSALLAEAQRRGLSITPVQEAQAVRGWESRLLGWAGAFGFETGMEADEIGERALLALGSTDQTARIAREEILEHRNALLAGYPVVVAGP
jgi:hypothetical protein